MTVSAVGTERLKSYYSSYGQGVVDVSAPGGDTRQPNPAVSTTANAVLSTHLQHGDEGERLGLQAGHLDGQPARGRRRGARPVGAPGPVSRVRSASLLERTAEALPCPEGVYNPRPGLDQFLAECTGGNRNGFYGAGEVNAFNAVS